MKDIQENNSGQDPNSVKFLIDGMLGSLARKLRILGYDTIYSEDEDSKLHEFAKSTRRFLVTSDSELYNLSRRRRLNSILIVSRTERGRLYEVLSAVGEQRIDSSRKARCSVCNGELTNLGKTENSKLVLTCIDCGKDYWKGSHWKRLSTLFDQVYQMLESKTGD